MLICGKSHAVLRGTSPDYGSWSKWAYYSLGSRSLCLGHSVLPLPCENRRLSMRFSWNIFCSSSSSMQTVYMSLSTGGYFTSATAGRNVGESFFPVCTKSSAYSPTKAPLQLCSSLQQNVQQSFTQQCSRTYYACNALRCARVNSNGSNALTCSSPLTRST